MVFVMVGVGVYIVPGPKLPRYTFSGVLGFCAENAGKFSDFKALMGFIAKRVESLPTMTPAETFLKIPTLWRPMLADLHAALAVRQTSSSAVDISNAGSRPVLNVIALWRELKRLVDGHFKAGSSLPPDENLDAYIRNSRDALAIAAWHAPSLRWQFGPNGEPQLTDLERRALPHEINFVLGELQQHGTIQGRNFLREWLEEKCRRQKLTFEKIYHVVQCRVGDSALALQDAERLKKTPVYEQGRLFGAVLQALNVPKELYRDELASCVVRGMATQMGLFANSVAVADAVAAIGILAGLPEAVKPFLTDSSGKSDESASPAKIAELPAAKTPQMTLSDEILECRRKLNMSPNNLALRLQLASLYMARGEDRLAALELLEIAAGESSDAPSCNEIDSRMERFLRDNPRIEEPLQKLSQESDKKNADLAQALLCTLFYHQQKFEQAIAIGESFLAKNPEDLGRYAALAYIYVNTGDSEKAIKIWSKLAELASRKNMPDVSIQSCELILGQDPRHVRALSGLFVERRRRGDRKQAIEMGERLCSAHLQQNEFDKAAAVYGNLLETGSKNDVLFGELLAFVAGFKDTHERAARFMQLGELAAKRKYDHLAAMSYEKVLEQNPNHVGALSGSLAVHCRAKRLSPKALETGKRLCAEYVRQKNFPPAILTCDTLLEKFPDNLSLHGNLAFLYSRTGRKEETVSKFLKLADLAIGQKRYNLAIKACKLAIKLDDSCVQAHYQLGILYADHENDVKNAFQEFHTVAVLKPEHVGAHSRLARMYASQGSTDEATDCVRILLADSKQLGKDEALKFLGHFERPEPYPIQVLTHVIQTLLEKLSSQGFTRKNFLQTSLGRIAKAKHNKFKTEMDPASLIALSDLSLETARLALTAEKLDDKDRKVLNALDHNWAERIAALAVNNSLKTQFLTAWAATQLAHKFTELTTHPDFREGLRLLSRVLSPAE